MLYNKNLGIVPALFVFMLSILISSCNSPINEAGIVKFRVVIESDLDSLSVSFSDPTTSKEIKRDIKQFPWSYEYMDFISTNSDWLIRKNLDSGYVKITFYSGEVDDTDNLSIRDSIRYYAPFDDFKYGGHSASADMNYYFRITASDSVGFRLRYNAVWAPFEIDTVVTNNWSYLIFEYPNEDYIGSVVNYSKTNSAKLELVTSGKNGRNSSSLAVKQKETIEFKIYQGTLNIIK